MKKYCYIFIISLMFFLLSGCAKQQNKLNQIIASKEFKLPDIPVMLTDSIEISTYIVLHYWDNYDFTDSNLIQKSDISESIFVNFISYLQNAPANIADSAIRVMMNKAQADSSVFVFFMSLCEKYFYEPTSPHRNDEFYIPALEIFIASDKIEKSQKDRPEFQLLMAQKNRIGTKTSDLKFKLTNGSSQNLYNTKPEVTLLFFYNPDCHACHDVLSKIRNSDLISGLISDNLLNIIALCTVSDQKEWIKNQSQIPRNWINGWYKLPENGKEIIYDLKASPTLYLLGKDKKVILKDAQIEQVIDYLNTMK